MSTTDSTKLAVVTVATVSHVGACLALFQSLIANNPFLDCICCMLDMKSPGKTQLKIETLSDSLIEGVHFVGWTTFASKGLIEARDYFDVFELSCAAKACAIRYVLSDMGYDKVIYLDSDIFCYADLLPLFRRLDSKDLLLTPHFIRPPALDGGPCNDYGLMQAGFMNAGFIAVKRSEAAMGILDWLENRILRYGFNAFHASLFVDQKWVSLLPLYFADHVEILSDPGVNVGHWNVSERRLEDIAGVIHAQGEPLRLFHFSGFNSKTPHKLTEHRYRLPSKETNVVLLRLCRAYASIVEQMTMQVSQWSVDLPISQTSTAEKVKKYEDVFRCADNEYMIKKVFEYDKSAPRSLNVIIKKLPTIIYKLFINKKRS